MLKELSKWVKAFPFPMPGFATSRTGVLPSAWSQQQWSTVLRGGIMGDVGLDQLMQASATISCCNLIADTLSSAEISVIQWDPDGGTSEVNEAQASDALLNFTYDDKSAMVFGAALLGNGFCFYDGSTLRTLDSFRTSAFVGQDDQVWLKEGAGPYLPYKQCAHVKFRAQSGFILGFNPALLAQSSLRSALGLIGMSGALATNAAQPSQVIEVATALSDKAIKNIKDSWNEAHAGDKQGGIAVLEEGAKLNQLKPPSATDSQMIEGLAWSSNDIARLYCIPGSLINLVADVNKSTAAEEGRAFYTRAIRPWAARVTDALSRQLLTPAERKQGLRVQFDLSGLQIGFGKEAAEFWCQLTNAGIAATNDGRDAFNLPDAPQGNRVRVPANMVFLDKLDQIPVGSANGQPAGTP